MCAGPKADSEACYHSSAKEAMRRATSNPNYRSDGTSESYRSRSANPAYRSIESITGGYKG